MIQAKGKIKVDNAKQSAAVQKALFAKGFGWYKSLEKEPQHTGETCLKWGECEDEPKRIFFSSSLRLFDDAPSPLHTLSDFNLDEDVDGNELPAFGNLKAGDPNPFVVGMQVRVSYQGRDLFARVEEMEPGPSVRVQPIGGHRQWAGYYRDGQVIGGLYNINDIFPVTTKQPAPQPITPGSKAIDTKNRTCQVLAIAEGFALCKYKEEPTQKHPVRAVELGKLRTKPDPVTVSLNCDYTATLDTDGATVGCQHISPEAMDELTAAWRKIREA